LPKGVRLVEGLLIEINIILDFFLFKTVFVSHVKLAVRTFAIVASEDVDITCFTFPKLNKFLEEIWYVFLDVFFYEVDDIVVVCPFIDHHAELNEISINKVQEIV
jgi:hypothetical protein